MLFHNTGVKMTQPNRLNMKQRGFTLIELLVTATIIAIIASVAIPSYQKNVQRSARSDGTTALLDLMRAQENFFANEFTYTNDLTELNYAGNYKSASQRYKISASACGAEVLTKCVLLTATPLEGQVSDGSLTLDSRGNRTHNGTQGWPKN